MGKFFFFTLIIVLLSIGWSGCRSDAAKGQDSSEDVKALIDSLMSLQQAHWNQGSPEGFMEYYWQSDSLLFIGKSGITKGWQATLNRYKKSYPDQQAMGRLQFTNLMFDQIDPIHCTVVGRWELFRTTDTLSGHYSLLWEKRSGKWVITMDHSS